MPLATAKPRRQRATTRESALRQDASALHEALLGLTKVLQFRDRDCICCYDISVTQCHALGVLASEGPFTLNELAAVLYLDKSTTSRVVEALDRKGYVTRSRHPEDGRAVLLGVSARGRKLQRAIESDLQAGYGRLLADVDPDVRHAAVELISRLARAAAAGVEVGGGSCCVRH